MTNKCKQCELEVEYFEPYLDGFCSEECMDEYYTKGTGVEDEQNKREMQFEEVAEDD